MTVLTAELLGHCYMWNIFLVDLTGLSSFAAFPPSLFSTNAEWWGVSTWDPEIIVANFLIGRLWWEGQEKGGTPQEQARAGESVPHGRCSRKRTPRWESENSTGVDIHEGGIWKLDRKGNA